MAHTTPGFYGSAELQAGSTHLGWGERETIQPGRRGVYEPTCISSRGCGCTTGGVPPTCHNLHTCCKIRDKTHDTAHLTTELVSGALLLIVGKVTISAILQTETSIETPHMIDLQLDKATDLQDVWETGVTVGIPILFGSSEHHARGFSPSPRDYTKRGRSPDRHEEQNITTNK